VTHWASTSVTVTAPARCRGVTHWSSTQVTVIASYCRFLLLLLRSVLGVTAQKRAFLKLCDIQILFCYLSMGLEWNPGHCYCGHLIGLLNRMTDGDDCGAISGMNEWMNGRGNRSTYYSYTSAALPTTNPTRLHPGSNAGRRGGKPATGRLSYGTAVSSISGTSKSV
jgi:hypothetical protein